MIVDMFSKSAGCVQRRRRGIFVELRPQNEKSRSGRHIQKMSLLTELGNLFFGFLQVCRAYGAVF
jgi:hypothetical protein